jgi:hypothetical protein
MGSWPPATINTMAKTRKRNEGPPGTRFTAVEMFHTHLYIPYMHTYIDRQTDRQIDR